MLEKKTKNVLENGWWIQIQDLVYGHKGEKVEGSDAPRGRLVVMGDSARIQDETESSVWFFKVFGV